MESKIANYTKEIKSKKWAEIVMNCNASGISKTAWCRENNVSLKSFFYWQHKLRLSMINQAERESAAEIVQINLQDESPLMKPATASDMLRSVIVFTIFPFSRTSIRRESISAFSGIFSVFRTSM